MTEQTVDAMVSSLAIYMEEYSLRMSISVLISTALLVLLLFHLGAKKRYSRFTVPLISLTILIHWFYVVFLLLNPIKVIP